MEQSKEISWKTDLAQKNLLNHTVENALKVREIDEIFIVTDIKELQACGHFKEVKIKPLDQGKPAPVIDLVNKDAWRVNNIFNLLSELDVLGDVHFFLNWRMPLLGAAVLEQMYHTLLEDRVAARVVCVYPVDPNLFTRFNGDDSYFPVWADIGADRQNVPQLYRSLTAGVIHRNRHKEIIPESKGFTISRQQGLEILEPDDLELAEFYLDKKNGCDSAIGFNNQGTGF